MASINFGVAGPDPADADAVASALHCISERNDRQTWTGAVGEAAPGPSTPWDRRTAYARHRVLASDRAQERLRTFYRAQDVDVLLVVSAHHAAGSSRYAATDTLAAPGVTVVDVAISPVVSRFGGRGPAGADEDGRASAAGTTLSDHLLRAVGDVGFEWTSRPVGEETGDHGLVGTAGVSREGASPAIVQVTLNGDSPRLATATTAYTLGGVLRSAITSWETEPKIGVLCQASLSGPAIDSRMDMSLLGAIELGDARDFLKSFPHYDGQQDARTGFMQWLVLCGLLEEMDPMVVDYVPLSASPGGPGRGLGFAYWYSWSSTSLFAYRRGLAVA